MYTVLLHSIGYYILWALWWTIWSILSAIEGREPVFLLLNVSVPLTWLQWLKEFCTVWSPFVLKHSIKKGQYHWVNDMVTRSDWAGFSFGDMPCFIQPLSGMSKLPLRELCPFKSYITGMAPFRDIRSNFTSLSSSPLWLLSLLMQTMAITFWVLSQPPFFMPSDPSPHNKVAFAKCKFGPVMAAPVLSVDADRQKDRTLSWCLPLSSVPSWCWPPSSSPYSSTPAPLPLS